MVTWIKNRRKSVFKPSTVQHWYSSRHNLVCLQAKTTFIFIMQTHTMHLHKALYRVRPRPYFIIERNLRIVSLIRRCESEICIFCMYDHFLRNVLLLFYSIEALSKEDAQQAFIKYASEKCCCSNRPAEEGVITNMEALNTYRVRGNPWLYMCLQLTHLRSDLILTFIVNRINIFCPLWNWWDYNDRGCDPSI